MPTGCSSTRRHRKLEVEDEIAGERLVGFFAARRLGLRPPRGDAPRGPRTSHADVEEVTLADTRALRVEWYLSYDHEPDTQEAIAAPRTASRSGAGCARS